VKLIVVGRKHAFAIEAKFPVSVARVQVSDSGDAHDEGCEAEDLAPDPRSVPHAHLENAAAPAKFADLDLEPFAIQAHRFGFGVPSGSGQ
jgi:hypothetical protein